MTPKFICENLHVYIIYKNLVVKFKIDYDDKEFAYLLDTKQRRKSSFSFFNNNNQQTEQDFNNFEKIFLSTAIPQSNFVHPELFKPEIPYNDDQKKKIGCASPKKEDIIKGV